jgi:F-type H+-transporting ATPase subunit b
MGQVRTDMTKTNILRGPVSALVKAAGRLRPQLAGWAKAVLPAAAMLLVFVAVAHAAGGEGGEEPTGKDWMWRTVNFAIIAALLVYIYVKHVKGALKSRIEGIEAALAEAKAAREEAITRLADVEARLKDKDAELARLVSVAQENGAKEKARLIEDGETISVDIIASAKEGIDAELIKAKDELRREAALLAVELAEKLIKENISADDRSRILEEYIAKVGG